MKMQRNIQPDGICKYALIRLDKLSKWDRDSLIRSVDRMKHERVLVSSAVIEFGKKFDDEECFVVKLKDINAEEALIAYANAAEKLILNLHRKFEN